MYDIREDRRKQLDIVAKIKRNRIRWAGHVQQMMDNRAVKKLSGDPGGRRRRERTPVQSGRCGRTPAPSGSKAD